MPIISNFLGGAGGSSDSESGILICNITYSNDTYACDKTTAEIYQSTLAGKLVYAKDSMRYYPLVGGMGPQLQQFAVIQDNGNLLGYQIDAAGTITAISVHVELTSNKVDSLSADSTDAQYPSAKCVWDLIGDVGTVINSINGIIGDDT